MFEVCYASALGDSASRRFLIGNAVSVSRVTLGKQTILSSGARDPMVGQPNVQRLPRRTPVFHRSRSARRSVTDCRFSPFAQQLRGPHDVINLGHVFGIDAERARHAACGAGEAAVAHGDTRANTHRGIVRKLATKPLKFPEADAAEVAQ
jgi:ribonuclease P/MRP protein subunit RPP1